MPILVAISAAGKCGFRRDRTQWDGDPYFFFSSLMISARLSSWWVQPERWERGRRLRRLCSCRGRRLDIWCCWRQIGASTRARPNWIS